MMYDSIFYMNIQVEKPVRFEKSVNIFCDLCIFPYINSSK